MTARSLFSLIAVAVLCTSFTTAPKVEADQVIGTWLSENTNEKIQIFKRGELFYGKIIWMRNEFDEEGNRLIDDKNPNKSLRTRPILGIEILQNFWYQGRGIYHGIVYDPSSGDTFKAKITILDKGRKAKVRGYIGIPLLGRTEICTKVD